MRTVVIGCLGSMGRRRIKILESLGHNVIGYDVKNFRDLKEEDIPCWYTDMIDEVENFLENPTGESTPVGSVFICTPPTTKQNYINMVNKYDIPVFTETDIMSYNGNYLPSRSLIFHPAIKKIKELVDNGALGQVYTFQYHCGMHIDLWRNGNRDIWQAKKETGGCRELFCFELAWLSWLFGEPIEAKGMVDKVMDDPEITADDVYSTVVKFNSFYRDFKVVDEDKNIVPESLYDAELYGVATKLYEDSAISGTVLIDLLSRPATRKLTIVAEKGILEWDCYGGTLKVFGEDIAIEAGIPESIYVDETKAFIEAITTKSKEGYMEINGDGYKYGVDFSNSYPYSKAEESKIMDMLRMVEE